jgi:hypothetical protein
VGALLGPSDDVTFDGVCFHHRRLSETYWDDDPKEGKPRMTSVLRAGRVGHSMRRARGMRICVWGDEDRRRESTILESGDIGGNAGIVRLRCELITRCPRPRDPTSDPHG